MKTSNRHMVSEGLFWKLLERFGVSGMRFILQIILARLLSPEHYGMLSIMIIFTTLANVFIQRGFNTALIQNKDVTEEDYSSVLWVSMGITVVLYAVIYASTPLLAAFYEMPDIVSPMRVLALMLFPGALNSVQLAKVSREMDFKQVFLSNCGGVIISGVVGIILAVMGFGLWALVAQSLLNVAAVCLVMLMTVRLKIRLTVNWARIRVLFSYGWKLLVSSLLETLYQDLHGLVIGKKYDSGTLGYHNRGQQFPQFIISAINGAVQSVLLPAMSAEQDDKNRLKTMTKISITTSAYLIFPMMAGLAAIAEPLVLLLLTEKWLPCVPYLQIYCITLAFYPIHSCNLQAINAVGRSDVFLKLEIIKKLYGIALLVFAITLFDSPLAIALTGSVSTLISWVVNAYPNKKLVDYAYADQLKDLLPVILMSAAMFGCVLLVGILPIHTAPKLLLQVAAGIAVYLSLSAWCKPEPFRLLTGKLGALRMR